MPLVLFVLGCLLAIVEGCGYGKTMIRSGGLSPHEKQAIVDAHNHLRQSVALGQVSSQPPAANMMEMAWDESLAAAAQRWADQCTLSHDRVAQRSAGRGPVGQNYAATWTTRPPTNPQDSEPEFMNIIHNKWYSEVRGYYFKPKASDHGTGHYSQLVWSETSSVGCGFSFYHDTTRGYTKIHVCNYAPGGNEIGSQPYEMGKPSCSSYGLAESRKYSGLCSSTPSYNSQPDSYISVIRDSNTYQYPYQQPSYHSSNRYQYQIPHQPNTYSSSVNLINLPTKPKSAKVRFGAFYV